MSETSTSNLTASKLEILKTRLRNDRENALAKLAIRKKEKKETAERRRKAKQLLKRNSVRCDDDEPCGTNVNDHIPHSTKIVPHIPRGKKAQQVLRNVQQFVHNVENKSTQRKRKEKCEHVHVNVEVVRCKRKATAETSRKEDAADNIQAKKRKCNVSVKSKDQPITNKELCYSC